MYKWNLNFQRELWAAPRSRSVTPAHAGRTCSGRSSPTVARRWTSTAASRCCRTRRSSSRRSAACACASATPSSWYKGLTVSLSRRARDFSTQIVLHLVEVGGYRRRRARRQRLRRRGGRLALPVHAGARPVALRHPAFVRAQASRTCCRSGRTARRLLSRLVRDWEIGTLVRLRSGYPFSVQVGYDQSLQVWAPIYPDLAPGASANPSPRRARSLLRSQLRSCCPRPASSVTRRATRSSDRAMRPGI